MSKETTDCVQTTSDNADIYCEPCFTDRKKTTANGFCEQCEEYLCDRCIIDHRKFAISRSHSVLAQTMMPSQGKKTQKRLLECTEPCAKHQNEIIKFFCKAHTSLVCSVCITLGHRICDVEYIPEASTNFRNNTECLELKREINNSIIYVETKMQDVRQAEDSIYETCVFGIDEIKDFRMEINAFLEHKEKELLDTIQELKRTNDSITDTAVTKLKNARTRLSVMNTSLEDNEANDIQLYMSAKTMVSPLKGIHTEVGTVWERSSFRDFKFMKNTALTNLLQITSAFGTIETPCGTDPKQSFLTACLSLGLTHTHLVWSFNSEYSPRNVCNGEFVIRGDKETTSVLVQPDGRTLESFGFEAEEKYLELIEAGRQNDYYFFEGFWRGMFDNTTITVGTTLKDKSGKQMRVVSIISLLIKGLLQRLLSETREKIRLTYEDIHLILTVPGNWNIDMKILMKLAVKKTDLEVGKLSIMLESEAAAVYCLHKKECNSMVHLTSTSYQKGDFSIPRTGEYVLICDFQESALVINLHEMSSEMPMKHITTEHDNTLGVLKLHEELEALINAAAGCEVIPALKKDFDSYAELRRRFKGIETSRDTFNIRIPSELHSYARDLTGRSLKELLQTSEFKNQIRLIKGDTIGVDMNIITSLLHTFVERVVGRMKEFVAKYSTATIGHVFVVSELQIPKHLQDGVKTSLPDMQVFIPERHHFAVLKGGILWGLDACSK